VTDGWTDGWTDGQTYGIGMAYTRLAYSIHAVARKKMCLSAADCVCIYLALEWGFAPTDSHQGLPLIPLGDFLSPDLLYQTNFQTLAMLLADYSDQYAYD